MTLAIYLNPGKYIVAVHFVLSEQYLPTISVVYNICFLLCIPLPLIVALCAVPSSINRKIICINRERRTGYHSVYNIFALAVLYNHANSVGQSGSVARTISADVSSAFLLSSSSSAALSSGLGEWICAEKFPSRGISCSGTL